MPLERADDEVAGVAGDSRARKTRDLRVGNPDRVLEVLGELGEAGAEDHRDVDPARARLLQPLEGGRDHFRDDLASARGGRRQRIAPATVAVMNEASVPAIMARMPIRDRSLRRAGAMPPMPPIWIAIELKFANPQSA